MEPQNQENSKPELETNPQIIYEGKPFEIPPEGSLGLLALGYKGIIAWRKIRDEFIEAQKKNNNT